MRRILLAAAAIAAIGLAPAANAVTFRFANDGDVNSMDPYARNETFLLTFNGNMYEPLVRRDRELKIEPALAVRWEQPDATTWRFHLRPGVRFHDGTPFTADDVAFSVVRAKAPGSNVSTKLATVTGTRVIDPLTIEFTTAAPNPILLEEIADFFIMSKAWAEKNNATQAADLTQRSENFATRNANGTGPFVLAGREPDRRTVLRPNADWWDKPEHNLTEVQFNVIANDATRVAALLSGEIDMIYTVPPQDTQRLSTAPNIRIHQKAELRTIFLGFDQWRDQLVKSDVTGRNPFRDARVRRAFYQAIDMEAIRTRVMRGQSRNSGLMWGPGINGFDEELDRRIPFDPDASKRLLTEAGYPNGFRVTMDCPNDRYVNDEAICQAVAAMLARVGVRIDLNAQTRARYFAEILGPRYNTSFYLLGWTPATYDAHNAMFNLMATREGVRGQFNVGNYSNARFDQLTTAIATETNLDKRMAMIREAAKIHAEEVGHIPLHQQQVIWAARSNIDLVQLADNWFPLRYVRVRQ
ncbi:MAG: ABC transporter substrate-binding protein [Acetobacteraceae bacterium]|nr:ABC transporter substrate-binding protein [Acetobacteraceae bacterium]